MRIKKIYFLILLVFSSIFISGCYDSREIDDMAYAIAVGMDKGKTNVLRMTFQFIKTGPSSSEGGEGEKSDGKNTVMTTIETPSIYSGINMVNNYVTKQVNMSHSKILVFSKELAEEGINKYINAFERSREFRGSMYVAVSRGTAEEFIKAAQPELQSNSARLFEGFFKTYKFTGFSIDSRLTDIFVNKQSLSLNPVASLVGVGKYESSNEFSKENSTYKEKGRSSPLEGDYKAGEMPKTYKVKAENVGLAVFDKNKMIGEMDGEETSMFLMNTGKYEHSFSTFEDPLSKENFVVLNVKQSRKPVHTVEIDDNKPKIKCKIILEADILSIQSGINYEDPEKIDIIETAAEEYFKKTMLNFLNKTSKEFKSDICEFGKEVKKKFLTWEEWKDYKWLEKYENASFEVEVSLKIRRPGLIIKSMAAE